MFRIESPAANSIIINPTNHTVVDNYIIDKCKDILGDGYDTDISDVMKNNVYDIVLRGTLAKELTKAGLEDNKTYLANISIGDNKYTYLISKLNLKDNRGVVVAKTLGGVSLKK